MCDTIRFETRENKAIEEAVATARYRASYVCWKVREMIEVDRLKVVNCFLVVMSNMATVPSAWPTARKRECRDAVRLETGEGVDGSRAQTRWNEEA